MKTKPRGFIALMSALIISSVLFLIMTGNSLSGFYTRNNSLLMEYKERSSAIAQGCVDQTLLALINNSLYAGNITTAVSGPANGTCFTGPVSGNSSTHMYVFEVQSNFNGAYTNFCIEAATSTLKINSFREVQNFNSGSINNC